MSQLFCGFLSEGMWLKGLCEELKIIKKTEQVFKEENKQQPKGFP